MSAVREDGAAGHWLRPMGYRDLPAVMVVEVEAYPFPWTEGIFRDCLRVGYACWVLESSEDGGIDGYAVMSMAVGEAHLLNLCIRPQRQGRGLGRRLLQQLLEKARGFDLELVFLEARPSNTAAVQLYLSEGFVEVGRRKDYYPAEGGREEAVVLRLDLK